MTGTWVLWNPRAIAWPRRVNEGIRRFHSDPTSQWRRTVERLPSPTRQTFERHYLIGELAEM